MPVDRDPQRHAAPQADTGHHPRTPLPRRLRAWGLATAAAAALLAACGGGGGGEDTAAGSGTTASATRYTAGTVTGFGSVIVNGVRFDDSGVTAYDDSGRAGALKLGMQVEVESGSVDSASSTAKALRIHFGSRVVGPVEAVGSGTLTVLGQVIDVVDATVFDDSLATGLSAVAVGSVVEVHGLPDAATGHILGTRIESASGTAAYKLRGTVAGLDTTAKTFRIGDAVLNYAGALNVPGTLANGSVVRALLSTTKNSAGQWVVTTMGSASASTSDGQAAEVRGTITTFGSSTSFSVNGLAVDASGVSSLPAGLALGVAVEVEGTVRNGVLVASKVELKGDLRGKDKNRFALIGAIGALDTSAKTFVLRGVKVDYSAATYANGTEAALANGVKVSVAGAVGTSRHTIKATTITFQ